MAQPVEVLRRATVDDAPAVVEFNKALAKETEDLDLDHELISAGVAALLSDPSKGTYFVAQVGDKVVAQLMITYEWSDWRNSQVLQPPMDESIGASRWPVVPRPGLQRRGLCSLVAWMAAVQWSCGIQIELNEQTARYSMMILHREGHMKAALMHRVGSGDPAMCIWTCL
eukprot:evm.model.scf_1368.1 EVM.evm.TU.scf_1368.1   scf_1368:26966-27967(+)